jgi:hypothetical protein
VPGYFARQRGRFSPVFFRHTSLAPEDDLAVEPAGEQNSPGRTTRLRGAGAWEYQRGRVSPPRLRQRAHDPVAVLPTAFAVVQNRPTFTTPETVIDARGAAGGLAYGRVVPGDALAAIRDACFFPPHPVNATAVVSTKPVRTSGRFIRRFMCPPISGPDQGLK